jgi:DNA polymerase-1
MKEKENRRKRLVILDTHAILHRAYHALPDFSSSRGEPTGALYGLVSMLVRIAADLHPDYIAAAFDLPKPTHRHIAYEKYKSHRPAADEALVSQIDKSREVLAAFGIPLYEKEGFEADDAIGTIVEEMRGNKDVDLIIASGDMDTLQLVDDERVRVFMPKKGLSETMLYDEEAVVARFGFGPLLIPDYKGLRGDPSDNIPGIKGVGEKTATILISTFGTLENLYKILKKTPKKIMEAGISAGMLEKLKAGEEDAEFSKMLALIRRDAPINFTLPTLTWRESAKVEDALKMLSRFEFRSLSPRVRELFNGNAQHKGEIPDDAMFADTPPAGAVPEDEFKKIALAVSVLDSGIAQPELEDVYRTGRSRNFEEAKKIILAEIKEKGLSFVYEHIELPLMPILRAMEQKGVRIDKKFLAQLSVEYHTELDKLQKKIFKAAGGEFNVNSPKQLGKILFDKLGLVAKKKTATGARSTRESELEKMKDMHPIIADILAHRELQKLLSTYIDNLPTLLDEHSRVHTTFIQIGAATGRLATQNPGLQNIPIKTELGRAIRRAFVAEKGHMLVAFDYSQIELRIAAWLSGDPGLIQIFKDGRDAHTEVASRVFHVRAEDVDYNQRRAAKVINFGILYGMGVTALQQSLGRSRKEAQEFYNQYFEAFPRLAAYIDEVKVSAATLGYTQTFFGRRRYFDGIKSPIPYVRAAAERMAVNAPMQGTQADIVKLAMIKIIEYLKEQNAHQGAHLLLQVHDELVFEIEEERVPALAPKIKEIMENVVPQKDRKGIPFVAEGKAGANWGEMKKI